MPDSPLLDLADAWKEVQTRLDDLRTHTDALYVASDETWEEMLIIWAQVGRARDALGTLPQGILDGIAKDLADLEDWAAKLG